MLILFYIIPKQRHLFLFIDNCFVTGSIQIQKDGNAGGLIGKSDANNTNTRCTISNCYTNVDITITGGNWKQCDAAGISCTQYTTIQNCYALGNIQLGSAQNNNQNKTSAYGINMPNIMILSGILLFLALMHAENKMALHSTMEASTPLILPESSP